MKLSMFESKGESTVAFSDYMSNLEERMGASEGEHEQLKVLQKVGLNFIKNGYAFANSEFRNDVFHIHMPRSEFFRSDWNKGGGFYYVSDVVKPHRNDSFLFIPSFGALATMDLSKVMELYNKLCDVHYELKKMS